MPANSIILQCSPSSVVSFARKSHDVHSWGIAAPLTSPARTPVPNGKQAQTLLEQTNKQIKRQTNQGYVCLLSVELTSLFFSSLKQTFSYNSEYWNNTAAYNEGGGTGLHDTETKPSTFWSTPFTRLCLGMKYQGETNWIALNYAGSSLRDVIGNGAFKETNLTVTEWKKLLNTSDIQVRENKRTKHFQSRTDSVCLFISSRI